MPAELLDYELYFFGGSGMGEAIPKKGASFHGVLHKMPKADQEKLDKIEATYVRQSGMARLYDGTEQEVTVYTRPNATRGPDIDKPPTERYLDIMMQGAKHFGVKEEYIEFLRNHEKQPRHKPEEFRSMPVPADDKKFTLQEIVDTNAKGDDLLMTVNGKVRQFIAQKSGMFYNFGKKQADTGIPSFEVMFSTFLYDPKYGTVKSYEELTREHAAYIEDMVISMQ